MGYIYSKKQQYQDACTASNKMNESSSSSSSSSRIAGTARQKQHYEEDGKRSYPIPQQFLVDNTRHLCNDYCSCNASKLREELECLRESTKNALYQSWDEVESLNQKCSSQEQLIASLRLELEESLKRQNELEQKWEESIKEFKKLSNNDDSGSGNGNMNMRRSTNNAMLSSLLDFTNHSAPAQFSQLLSRKKSNSSINKNYDGGNANYCYDNTNCNNKLVNNKSYHSDQQSITQESKHSTAFSVLSSEDAMATDDEALRDDFSLGTSRRGMRSAMDDVVDNLREKLESREQEISALENVIVENMKTFQELHSQLEGRGQDHHHQERKEKEGKTKGSKMMKDVGKSS